MQNHNRLWVDALRAGHELQNAAQLAKSANMTATVLSALVFLDGIMKAFGMHGGTDVSTLEVIAQGIVALGILASAILHTMGSKNASMLPNRDRE